VFHGILRLVPPSWGSRIGWYRPAAPGASLLHPAAVRYIGHQSGMLD
jgi:hypothetical protein